MYFVFVYFLVIFVWLSVQLKQLIAWKIRLRNDLLCIEWDVKPYIYSHSQYRMRMGGAPMGAGGHDPHF